MTIKQFELYHGAVLTALVRSDRPVTLRMIETRPSEAWAVYTLNDEVDLYVKYSTAVRALRTRPGAFSWTFVFGSDEVLRLSELRAEREVYAALVCARKAISQEKGMHTCLLQPGELARLIDLDDHTSQSTTVRYIPRKKFRLFSGHRVELRVAQSALARWEVPGS
jgi:hypothetical protein